MNKIIIYAIVVFVAIGALYWIFRDRLPLGMQKTSPGYMIEATPTAGGPALVPTTSATTEPESKVKTETIVITLNEQNGSGESGTAVLTQQGDGKTKVVIDLAGAPQATPQPAHIHVGSCPTPEGVKYPLTNVINGKSTTVLDVSFETLKAELPLAVNAHKSTTEAGIYVACGDVRF